MTRLVNTLASTDVHISVVDALLRFGAGTDDGDVVALKSAFAGDAVVDFSACGRSIGLDFAPLRGADTIVSFLEGTSQHQMTSHVVTNSRVHLNDDRAHLRALVDATHVIRDDPARRFRMMNWYETDLVLIDGLWRIVRMAIDNIWAEGDATVLFVR